MTYEVIESLQYYKNRFEELGYDVQIWNCGTVLWVDYEKEYSIEIEEVYRRNGTAQNRNVRMGILKRTSYSTHERVYQGSKVSFDARDSLKEKRIAQIIEKYNEYQQEAK